MVVAFVNRQLDNKMRIADIALSDISALGGVETGTRYRLPYFANKGYEVYSISRYPQRKEFLPQATRRLFSIPSNVIKVSINYRMTPTRFLLSRDFPKFMIVALSAVS